MTKAQATQIAKLVKQFRQECQAQTKVIYQFRGVRGTLAKAREEASKTVQVMVMETAADYLPKLAEILKEEQAQRLSEIAVQAAGLNAYAMPRVEKALKLNSVQKAEIKKISDDMYAKIREIINDKYLDNTKKFLRVTLNLVDSREAAMKLLTATQQAVLKELMGRDSAAALALSIGVR